MSTKRTSKSTTMENPEYAQMLRRMIRNYGRRVGDSDWNDLAAMVEVRDELDRAIAHAVTEQRRRFGFSSARIGEGFGITRQGAYQRWGK